MRVTDTLSPTSYSCVQHRRRGDAEVVLVVSCCALCMCACLRARVRLGACPMQISFLHPTLPASATFAAPSYCTPCSVLCSAMLFSWLAPACFACLPLSELPVPRSFHVHDLLVVGRCHVPCAELVTLLHNARFSSRVSDKGCSLDLALLPLSVCLCVRFRLVVLEGCGVVCVCVSSSVGVFTPDTLPNTTAAGRERFLHVASLAWCEDGRLRTSQGTQVTMLKFPRKNEERRHGKKGQKTQVSKWQKNGK